MYQTIFTPFHYQTTKRLRYFFITLGIILWLGASVTAFAPSLPHLLYRLSPNTPNTLAATISNTVPSNNDPLSYQDVTSLPPKDPSLPQQNTLIIDKIGVNGQIHEGDNWEEILKNGIWRTPDWGTPESSNRPIILASHRWGYLDWTNTFRKLNSFYNLPKLEPGDTISIIWNQRQYNYQVFLKESSESITDFSADLILYTCQLWNSPIRIFVYAKHLD